MFVRPINGEPTWNYNIFGFCFKGKKKSFTSPLTFVTRVIATWLASWLYGTHMHTCCGLHAETNCIVYSVCKYRGLTESFVTWGNNNHLKLSNSKTNGLCMGYCCVSSLRETNTVKSLAFVCLLRPNSWFWENRKMRKKDFRSGWFTLDFLDIKCHHLTISSCFGICLKFCHN